MPPSRSRSSNSRRGSRISRKPTSVTQMEVDDEVLVRLKSLDNKRFVLSKSEASCSHVLRNMLASLDHGDCEWICIDALNGELLAKVCEWCKRHPFISPYPIGDKPHQALDSVLSSSREIAPTGADSHIQHELTDWDKSFLNELPDQELFQLMHAANFLHVASLFGACCKLVAKRWQNKRVDEIRHMYSIENDFDYNEEQQLALEAKRLGATD